MQRYSMPKYAAQWWEHTLRCSAVKPAWVAKAGWVMSVCVPPKLTAPRGILSACMGKSKATECLPGPQHRSP